MRGRLKRLQRTVALGVVIPAKNEEDSLGEALYSLERSFAVVADGDIVLRAAVLLDSCRDASAALANEWKRVMEKRWRMRVIVLDCVTKNVGHARGLGCDALLDDLKEVAPEFIWLATTDADSQVPAQWLHVQVKLHERGMDMWAGRVAVSNWAHHRREVAAWWQKEYDREVHPIHGANLGFNAQKYLAVGGFRSIPTGEDRALVSDFVEHGAKVHFDSSVRVITSDRRESRAPDGFASVLNRLDSAVNTSLNPSGATPVAIVPGGLR
jgi:hypothetical protein